MTGITGSHHILGVEHLERQLWNCQGSVGLGSTRCQWCKSRHEEVQARERHHIDGQFSQVCVQLARKSETSCDARHRRGDQVIQVPWKKRFDSVSFLVERSASAPGPLQGNPRFSAAPLWVCRINVQNPPPTRIADPLAAWEDVISVLCEARTNCQKGSMSERNVKKTGKMSTDCSDENYRPINSLADLGHTSLLFLSSPQTTPGEQD